MSRLPKDMPPGKMIDIKVAATKARQRAFLADMAHQLAALDARKPKKGTPRK